jgi:hypothetical protein
MYIKFKFILSIMLGLPVVTWAQTLPPPPPPGGAPPGFPLPGIIYLITAALGLGIFQIFKNPKK